MKFLLLSFLLLVGLPAPPRLTTVKLGPGLSVGVPAGFAALPDATIALKFPAPRKPLAVFSNPAGRVDYSVAARPTQFGPDYKILLAMYRASIQRLYTKVDFLSQDVRRAGGRDFAVLEFVSTLGNDSRGTRPLAPIRQYQQVAYTVQGEQLYIFTFSAPAEEQSQWRPVAKEVLGAVSLK